MVWSEYYESITRLGLRCSHVEVSRVFLCALEEIMRVYNARALSMSQTLCTDDDEMQTTRSCCDAIVMKMYASLQTHYRVIGR